MRILLLSDIHANLEALESCLAAAPAHDRIVNLGDVVGYGASPNEAVNQSRRLGGVLVRGNHDKACSGVMSLEDFNPVAALAALWTREILTAENLTWLRDLPQGPIPLEDVEDVQCVHGSPLDEDEYLLVIRDAIEPLVKAATPLTFFGHTHVQGGFAIRQGRQETLRPTYDSKDGADECRLSLHKEGRYLINPGSIGQPRDGDWRAAFALFDSEKYDVTFLRLPYDVKGAQKRILDAGLPERLATRLAEGR